MPDWVNVIPVTPQGKVVVIRQYRHGTGEISLEIPGGVVDAGESHEETARRELLEETGYTAGEIIPIGRVAANPAIQDNHMHTFLALGARAASASPGSTPPRRSPSKRWTWPRSRP